MRRGRTELGRVHTSQGRPRWYHRDWLGQGVLGLQGKNQRVGAPQLFNATYKGWHSNRLESWSGH